MDRDDLAFAPIARQAELVRAGEVSPTELVETYLERIERIDPKLNSFRVVMAERALTEARQAEGRRGEGDERPLLGVPVAIKDDTDVAGEVTAHGVDQLNPPAERDAEVVRRLRAAGAIVIGKTNVSELTAQPFTETAAFGATRNPWSPEHSPGGSSGGSGAAVAAGLAGAALGSDGAGSIRLPAAFCSLFGLKPQRGRVSEAPKPEAWRGLSVHGPIVRTVADAALWLDATHGLAQGDAGSPAPAPSEPFAAAAARPPGKLRIAVSTKLLPGIVAPLAREPREAVEETAELLRSLGHDVVERDPDYDPRSMGNAVIRIMRGVDDDARNFRPRSRLERRTRGWARLGRTLPDSLVARARADEAAIAARFLRLFDDHDVLLTPAASKPPMRVGAYDGRGWLWTMVADTAFICYTVIANITGQPAATLPAGLDANGLPRGVQLIARPNDEATLLSLSAQIEAERPWVDQRPPVS